MFFMLFLSDLVCSCVICALVSLMSLTLGKGTTYSAGVTVNRVPVLLAGVMPIVHSTYKRLSATVRGEDDITDGV